MMPDTYEHGRTLVGMNSKQFDFRRQGSSLKDLAELAEVAILEPSSLAST
jgi:hypothetical protein